MGFLTENVSTDATVSKTKVTFVDTNASHNLTVPTGSNGEWFTVSDMNRGGFGITLLRSGTDTIMGLTSYLIATDDPGWSFTFVFNASRNEWTIK
jgi:hypothetical protein